MGCTVTAARRTPWWRRRSSRRRREESRRRRRRGGGGAATLGAAWGEGEARMVEHEGGAGMSEEGVIRPSVKVSITRIVVIHSTTIDHVAFIRHQSAFILVLILSRICFNIFYIIPTVTTIILHSLHSYPQQDNNKKSVLESRQFITFKVLAKIWLLHL